MPTNIKEIKLWADNPQKDRISNVVKIEFNFPCIWTTLDIKDLLKILELWIVGEEMKYPLDRDVGLHRGVLRGRNMLLVEVLRVFGNVPVKVGQEKK